MPDHDSRRLKTRFCPSPTGKVHLGNIRTALFNALFARHADGTFLLRIEDTDRERSQEVYTQLLCEDMLWLGLTWDEGPLHAGIAAEGEHGPYWQSERAAFYDQYYQILEQTQSTYPCFCSQDTLALSRKTQLAAGRPPRYAGTCAHLSEQEVAAKIDAGQKPVLRFRVPAGETISFTDLVRGDMKFQSDDLGDFVIRRADGTPPFMFCNAVDDASMGVTHALRGEDHITNTPRQIMILQALGLPVPEYGHISLIVGPDGSPLSKRHGSRSVSELRAMGYLPQAINNYLARLGHHYRVHEEKLMTLAELAECFEAAGLVTSSARYDVVQLNHWQQLTVQQLSMEALIQWLAPVCATLPDACNQEDFITAVRDNILFPQDAQHWRQVIFDDGYTFELSSTERSVLIQAGETFYQAALEIYSEQGADWKALCQEMKSRCQCKGKALFQPLRLALTGQLDGPVLAPILAMMPRKVVLARLQWAKSLKD